MVVTIILITTKEGSGNKGEGGLSKENDIKLSCTCAAFHKKSIIKKTNVKGMKHEKKNQKPGTSKTQAKR